VVFAYATLDLFQMSMANIRFLRDFGVMAVMESAPWQLLQIHFSATVAMTSYIGFRICEGALVHRYHAWQIDSAFCFRAFTSALTGSSRTDEHRNRIPSLYP
jgi:hypothetical protein